MKWGLVAIFAGLGTLTAMVLDNWYHYDEGAIFPGVILVFGGVGLVVFYLIASKKQKSLNKSPMRFERLFLTWDR